MRMHLSSSSISVHIIANAKKLNICDAILDLTSIFGAFWRDFCKIMAKARRRSTQGEQKKLTGQPCKHVSPNMLCVCTCHHLASQFISSPMLRNSTFAMPYWPTFSVNILTRCESDKPDPCRHAIAKRG